MYIYEYLDNLNIRWRPLALRYGQASLNKTTYLGHMLPAPNGCFRRCLRQSTDLHVYWSDELTEQYLFAVEVATSCSLVRQALTLVIKSTSSIESQSWGPLLIRRQRCAATVETRVSTLVVIAVLRCAAVINCDVAWCYWGGKRAEPNQWSFMKATRTFVTADADVTCWSSHLYVCLGLK